jgi:peptidyl-prolyl cis-trans isomerase D
MIRGARSRGSGVVAHLPWLRKRSLMLEAIRKRAGSFVVKILFLVLVLSFVVWGVADVFRPGRDAEWAAKIGDSEITTEAFRQEYRVALQRLGQALGKPMDAEQARALGLPASVLNRMVDGALYDKAADDLGLRVGDATVREAITTDSRFHNQQGSFDAEIFRETLRRNGLSEERYVELMRQELRRQQLLESLLGGVVPPRALVDSIERYQGERRVAEYVRVDDSSITGIAAPDEPALRQFYQDFPGLFTAPEYRAVSAVILSADTVAKGIGITDSELEAAYRDRAGEFTRPERRSFRQMVFADEESARHAREKLAQGATFEAVAGELGKSGGAEAVIGPVARAQLPAELADAVFQLPKGGTSAPIKSPLGWHVVEVSDIEAGSVQPLAEVKEQLTAELKREKAADALIELGNKLDDTLGRGAALDEAAGELGLSVRKIPAIDARGLDAAGVAVPELPERLVDTAFQTAANSESTLIEADRDTYFVVRVESVTPSAVQPFEAVRGKVESAWLDHERSDRAKRLAEDLAERTRAGGSLSALATEKGYTLIKPPAFTRSPEDAPAGLPKPLIAAMFGAKAGEVTVVPVDDGFIVTRLVSIEPPSAEAASTGEANLRSQLTSGLQGDLLAQLSAALRSRYSVSINPRAFDSL